MKLEFDLYKVEDIGKNLEGFIQKGEFIVVGELMVDNEEHFMCHPIKEGIKLIDDVNIQDFSYRLPKDKFEKTGESVTLDIPKKYLTLDIIEDIQRLN
jgi:hypothetical protein